ncbi:MAG: ribosomal protein [Fibrobacterota bacterium]|jgi:large subunit ribosomal protein L25
MTSKLATTAREVCSKPALKAIRAAGRIPAVVYGRKAQPQSISIDADEFRIFLVAGNRNRLVDLELPTGTVKAFIKEIVREKLRRDVLHIDFQLVNAGDTITYKVPVKCVGVPVGVKIGGGNLNVIKKDVKVKVSPEALVDVVEADVSEIEKGQAFFVRDIKFPGGTILTPAGQAVAIVS